MARSVLSALRACNFSLKDPGAARFALAPGYLLAAPSALPLPAVATLPSDQPRGCCSVLRAFGATQVLGSLRPLALLDCLDHCAPSALLDCLDHCSLGGSCLS